MNLLDKALNKTPESDDSYHCPWFRLIEFFALFGFVFGLASWLAYGVDLGLIALSLACLSGAFSFGKRSRSDITC